ncbi:hypothetical protein IKG06_01750 [Candidatus Saccharibacteria bacterium]|nr:hypothetical protein [Candidatus Saccharibacteria bacterium]
MARLWKKVCISLWRGCGDGVEKFVENCWDAKCFGFYCEKHLRTVRNFLCFAKKGGLFCGKKEQGGIVTFSAFSAVST